jgi:hypothetical protein
MKLVVPRPRPLEAMPSTGGGDVAPRPPIKLRQFTWLVGWGGNSHPDQRCIVAQNRWTYGRTLGHCKLTLER